MNQATFVCNKNGTHQFTRISDNLDGRLPCISCDGWMYPAGTATTAVPFQLWCFIGGWKPVCTKHRKIFMSPQRYFREHAECKGGSYPYSDLAICSGYRKVWLP